MSKFDFSKLRESLTGYTQTLKALRIQIEATERAIEDVMFAPLAKHDAQEAISAWVDSSRLAWRKNMVASLATLPQKAGSFAGNENGIAPQMYMRPMPSLGVADTHQFQARVDGHTIQAMVCGLFPEAVQKALLSALDDVSWPDGGLPNLDRQKKLKDLRDKLEMLKKEEAALVGTAEEVGMDVDRIA